MNQPRITCEEFEARCDRLREINASRNLLDLCARHAAGICVIPGLCSVETVAEDAEARMLALAVEAL